ncbi:hypothetical protein N0V90_010495 [Kalmusia sp. IMI 367209]|nr:hypothetical protein N0V90_010495 [Kalmusia sp. IMI 367209]
MNLGALTTTYIPGPGCNDTIYVPQVDGDKTTYMETTLGGPMIAYAEQIQIRYQKADFETAASSTMSTSAQSSSQTSASPSRPSDAGAKPTGESGDKGEENKGLGTGAYAGIGVGAAAVLVAMVGVLVFCVKRRRETDAEKERVELDGAWGQSGNVAEMAPSTRPWEVGDREPGEVKGDMVMPQELDPRTRVHEM